MWDFSLCLLSICLLLHFSFIFLIINQIFLALNHCPSIHSRRKKGLLEKKNVLLYTVAGIHQHMKDYRMYLGISAVNDKFYHLHYKEVWCLLGLIVT